MMIKTSRQLKDLTRNFSKGASSGRYIRRSIPMRTALLGMRLYLLFGFYVIVAYPITRGMKKNE